jgi:hypothetical protein
VTIGITLRLTDTRGTCSHPAAIHASLKTAICSARNSSNGTPVSSNSSVELMRFIPGCPTHAADSLVTAPHQIRLSRPGDCGWIGSMPAAPTIADPTRRRPRPRSRSETARASSVPPASRRSRAVHGVAEGLRATQRRLGRAARSPTAADHRHGRWARTVSPWTLRIPAVRALERHNTYSDLVKPPAPRLVGRGGKRARRSS